MDINVAIKTTAVTVFPDQARVTVTGQVELNTGMHRLLIDELPLGLLSESVRISGRGEAGVHILGVDVRRIHYEETPAEALRLLSKQIEELEDNLQELSDQELTIDAQLEYLDGMRSATKQYAKALSKGITDAEYQLSLTHFFRDQDQQLRSEVRELSKQKRTLERRLDKLREELNENYSALPTTRHRVLVDVEVVSAGIFNLEASFVVRDSSWQPLYDIRLSNSNGETTLEITSLAQVQQETGQDWSDIALTISTARPAMNQRKPILKPWYIGPPVPSPVKSRNIRMAAAVTAQVDYGEGVALAEDQILSGRDESPLEARSVAADAQITDLAVIYKVTRRADIPSDGSPRKVTLAEYQFEPDLDYLTVPKHTDAVYRRIKAVNNSPGPLLPGPASLFSGEDYVGNIDLEFVPSDGDFELLLGVEDGIVIKRELIQRDVDKTLLRDRRQLLFGHKIELTNLLSEEVNIEIQDHIPVARHEDIKVRLMEADPEPVEHSDLNMLTWELSILPEQEQVIQYTFRVDYPRDMIIVGLGRR